MFYIPGRHVSHQDLAYLPSLNSAITSCTPSQVIVAEDDALPCLHIHQLPRGEEIHTISHTVLDLEYDNAVYAVHCADSKLHLAVGRSVETKALHVYEVRPHLTVMIIQTNVFTYFLYSYKIHTQHSIQN